MDNVLGATVAENPKGNGEQAAMKVQGIGVKKATEPWTEYLLEDGTTLRLRIVLIDVGRAVDTFDEAGNPVYQFKHTTIVDIKAPDRLRRKK